MDHLFQHIDLSRFEVKLEFGHLVFFAVTIFELWKIDTCQSQGSPALKHLLPYGLFDSKRTIIYEMKFMLY